MVSLPVEGRWSIKPLGDEDVAAVLSFLRRDPLINIYMIARLLDESSAASSQIFAVRRNRELMLAVSLSTNIVLATRPDLPADAVETAIAVVADRIVTRMVPVRAVISPAPLVESLWRHLRVHVDPPTVVRMTQPIYATRRRLGFPDLNTARFATLSDLDRLVPACAAMHREEVGIDPLERDAAGYRDRIRDLIERRRSLIVPIGREIAAKCEFSAVTEEAVQLMGVWTHPDYRRRGLARTLLSEVCGYLFHRGKAVTLFVNDFNRPAVALYESLGFEQIGINRALIW